MKRIVATVFLCAPLFAACGDDLKSEGEECITSSECGPGLLCDTALSPPACARMGAPRPDLAGADLSGPKEDLAGADLAGLDLSANPAIDMAGFDMASAD